MVMTAKTTPFPLPTFKRRILLNLSLHRKIIKKKEHQIQTVAHSTHSTTTKKSTRKVRKHSGVMRDKFTVRIEEMVEGGTATVGTLFTNVLQPIGKGT